MKEGAFGRGGDNGRSCVAEGLFIHEMYYRAVLTGSVHDRSAAPLNPLCRSQHGSSGQRAHAGSEKDHPIAECGRGWTPESAIYNVLTEVTVLISSSRKVSSICRLEVVSSDERRGNTNKSNSSFLSIRCNNMIRRMAHFPLLTSQQCILSNCDESRKEDLTWMVCVITDIAFTQLLAKTPF